MNPAEYARLQSQVLIECLPYMRAFHGQTVVIKYGGHAMIDEQLRRGFALNVALLKLVGINPVIVHGGGPQIGTMLEKLHIESEFREGLRVTDQATMNIVEMVLVGSVNKDIVNNINLAGARAVGLSGKDGMLLRAKKLEMILSKTADVPEIIDLGSVGEVISVEISLINSLLRDGFIPVIAPVGVDALGQTYNINADDVAGAVAGALKAKRLILLTDVEGILDKNKELVRFLTHKEAVSMMDQGVVSGGMIPKIKCCLEAIQDGVEKVMIVDGRVDNCILLELFTDQGVGTQMVHAKHSEHFKDTTTSK